jgi:AAA15 family ATPase/GTPase
MIHVKIQKLGVINEAEMDVGDLTIICGYNNTGKTYVSYALYGFLEYWSNLIGGFRPSVAQNYLQEYFRPFIEMSDTAHIDSEYLNNFKNKIIDQALQEYRFFLQNVFATTKEFIQSARIEIAIDDLPIDDSMTKLNKDKFFSRLFPEPFYLCDERCGIMMLWSEYDSTDHYLMDADGTRNNRRNGDSTIPFPVLRNLDFLRKIKNGKYRKDGVLASQFPDIFERFKNLFGGDFKVIDGIPFFIPLSSSTSKLRMNESSGEVRALFLLGNYLRYVAAPGDILIIDEPELNLHPEKQCQIARLLARLVNAGIKIFITTHSDFLIRELNALIMLNQNKPCFDKLREESGYAETELLDATKIRAYTIESEPKIENGYKLYPANIDQKRGIEITLFDKTIIAINELQDQIVDLHRKL